MPRKIALTTLRRNIERDSRAYFIKHKTHFLLKALAKHENRPTANELDALVERVAFEILDASVMEQAEREAQALTEQRRQEAEARRPELEHKRASQHKSS